VVFLAPSIYELPNRVSQRYPFSPYQDDSIRYCTTCGYSKSLLSQSFLPSASEVACRTLFHILLGPAFPVPQFVVYGPAQ
jgi:hypothetical protein